MKRIDNLTPGTEVVLRFVGRWGNETHEEPATFLRIERGLIADDRLAHFRSPHSDGTTYEWRAYRYQGRWAYGTGADPLQLADDGEPAPVKDEVVCPGCGKPAERTHWRYNVERGETVHI